GYGGRLREGPLRLSTRDLTTALEIVRIRRHGHLSPQGELLGVADQTREETALSIKDLDTTPIPGILVPRTDIHVAVGVYGHVGRIRQRTSLRARGTDLSHEVTIAGVFLDPMIFVIRNVHVALVVHGDAPWGIQFVVATAQAAPTAQQCPIGCELTHLMAATVGHEQGVVGINGDARGPVGFVLAVLDGVPARQEVPLLVEDGHPVQPFVGYIHVSLGINNNARRPDQLAWSTAVAAELSQVLFFSRLAAQGDLADPLAYTRAIPRDVADALTAPVDD